MLLNRVVLERDGIPAVEIGVGVATMLAQLGIILYNYSQAQFLPAVLATVLSLIVADAVSYLFHYAFDSYDFAWNSQLRKIAADFKSHHDDYLRVVRNGPLRNGVLYLCLFLTIPETIVSSALCDVGSFAAVFWAVQCLCQTLVPDVHRFAHGRAAPKPIRFLQKHRILLPPRWHRHHHPGKNRDHRGHWALFNGWTNPLLDRIFK